MRRRAALAWGLVGGLSFLVLLGGWELRTGTRIAWPAKLGVALLVTAAAGLLAPVAARSAVRWKRG